MNLKKSFNALKFISADATTVPCPPHFKLIHCNTLFVACISLLPMLLWFPGPPLLVQRVLVCCLVGANRTFGTHTEDMQRVSSSNHLDSLLPGSCLSLRCLLLPLNCFSLRCSDYAGDQHFQHLLMLFPLYCNSSRLLF